MRTAGINKHVTLSIYITQVVGVVGIAVLESNLEHSEVIGVPLNVICRDCANPAS